tara:strand:- start:1019 stop:1507 length:489 start_codon:yes stop_codon:yes gene_type:complete
MEEIKAETEDEDMVPSQPIDIPAPPAPTDMQLMLKHIADMEERLKPKPKPKRKATEKQAAALERARAARAVTTLERNRLKKELKQQSKITEKKFVNEGLEKLKTKPDDNTTDVLQDSTHVSDYIEPSHDHVDIKQVSANIPEPDMQPTIKSLKSFNFGRKKR